MLKKALIGGGLAVLLSSITVGTPLFSYARTGASWVRQSAADSMPIEWELKRARQMIADLQPEIKTAAKQIALEKVEVARLEKQLADNDSRLAKSRRDIERLSQNLESDSQSYTYAGRTYTYVQVEKDLSNRFKRHKTRKATSDKLGQMVDARKASLTAANERLDAMLQARRQLEVEVENLAARCAALRVSQTASELSVDDSALSQTRALLDGIAARIDVEEETMHVDNEYFGGINLDEPSDEDLIDEIAVYFSAEPGTDADETIVAIQLD